jgi:hypothetical protein
VFAVTGHQLLTPTILQLRRITVQSQPGQIVKEDPPQKYPTLKRAGGVTEVVQCLHGKHEALSSRHAFFF